MEWFQAIVGALSGGLLTALGGIFYLKSRMQKEGAEADMAKTEASKLEYAHLLERITNAEKMYAQQGEIISELRQQVLKLSSEKFESDQKVQVLTAESKRLKAENENLRMRVDELAAEVDAYKHQALLMSEPETTKSGGRKKKQDKI